MNHHHQHHRHQQNQHHHFGCGKVHYRTSPAGGAGSPVPQVETAGAVKPAASQLVPLGHPPEEGSTRVAGQPSVVKPGLGHLNIADTTTAHSKLGWSDL